jgi:hypothetical protein
MVSTTNKKKTDAFSFSFRGSQQVSEIETLYRCHSKSESKNISNRMKEFDTLSLNKHNW